MTGDKLTTIWKAPKDCSKEERTILHDMVLLGGEVGADGFMGRIERAERLVFCKAGELIVGVAGLKRPSERYRRDTECKAKVDLSAEHWPWEFGWVFVCPGARGQKVSHRLVNCGLHEITEPIFATSRADNPFMHSPLIAAGFKRVGEEYKSDRHGGPMLVFQRPSP